MRTSELSAFVHFCLNNLSFIDFAILRITPSSFNMISCVNYRQLITINDDLMPVKLLGVVVISLITNADTMVVNSDIPL